MAPKLHPVCTHATPLSREPAVRTVFPVLQRGDEAHGGQAGPRPGASDAWGSALGLPRSPLRPQHSRAPPTLRPQWAPLSFKWWWGAAVLWGSPGYQVLVLACIHPSPQKCPFLGQNTALPLNPLCLPLWEEGTGTQSGCPPHTRQSVSPHNSQGTPPHSNQGAAHTNQDAPVPASAPSHPPACHPHHPGCHPHQAV